MKIIPATITQDELMAFVDGELEAGRAQVIEQQAQHDGELAATLAALRAQQQALRASLDPVLDEPIPARLLRSNSPTRFSRPRVAAALVWLTLGVIAGSQLSGLSFLTDQPAFARRHAAHDLPRFVHQAVVAYGVFAPEVHHPVELGSADAQALNTWLSKRLQRQMQAPDLTQLGFSLVGGRLLPGETNKPAAQFMYEDRQGQRITMYLRGMAEPTAETAFRFVEQGPVNTFYWVEGDWGYALSGELSRNQLLQIAQTIHGYLSERLGNQVSAIIPL